jgi:TIR domain
MSKIFISYRRDDASAWALMLRDDLVRAFGKDRVFRDQDALHAGNWREQINLALERCKVVLVVIGRSWLSATDETGKRRLDRADDVHRQEIAAALARSGVTVIPVLVDGASMPRATELPEELQTLADQQARTLSGDSAHRDVDLRRLTADIEKATGRKPIPPRSSLPLTTEHYLAQRGPYAHRDYTGRPGEPWQTATRGHVTVQDLRARLIEERIALKKPVPIAVGGTLFPCALLSSGWWEKHGKAHIRRIKWADPNIQEWLFHGFELWGPSWDFTWNFEHWERSRDRPYFIAQLGDGDEANSVPVLIPHAKAIKLQGELGDALQRGIQATVIGVLGHRKHFAAKVDPLALELFGGLLDYCLWVDEDNAKHRIELSGEEPEVYSGYLWKCVVPKKNLADHKLTVADVYFIWEHTNFASPAAVAYNLDGLRSKEEYLERRCGELVLVQKSSTIVPGDPRWNPEDIYGLLLGKKLAI